VFQPKYIKQGKLLRKGVRKFFNYKRDLIPAEKLGEIETASAEFDAALASKDKAEIERVAKRLTGTCEKAVPAVPHSGLRENLEVIFVAVVIAVGIRAYFLQPFKIPTGSMQPTLNGIIAYQLDEKEFAGQKPGFLGGVWSSVFAGRKYVDEVMGEDKSLVRVETATRMKFFPYTTLYFSDRTTKTIKLPLTTLTNRAGEGGTGFGFLREQFPPGIVSPPYELKAGTVIARGYVDTGDQVLVDKVSYHFRKPRRGEVFVFSTKDIAGIQVPIEQGSQHYIKRLVGVPGDTLDVGNPQDVTAGGPAAGELFINGARATERGMVRVMDVYPKTNPLTHSGYEYNQRSNPYTRKPPVNHFDLKGRREYVAMGDNSHNSADSRSWGTVPEVNVVGPAFVVYWPFAHHWGIIR